MGQSILTWYQGKVIREELQRSILLIDKRNRYSHSVSEVDGRVFSKFRGTQSAYYLNKTGNNAISFLCHFAKKGQKKDLLQIF